MILYSLNGIKSRKKHAKRRERVKNGIGETRSPVLSLKNKKV